MFIEPASHGLPILARIAMKVNTKPKKMGPREAAPWLIIDQCPSSVLMSVIHMMNRTVDE